MDGKRLDVAHLRLHDLAQVIGLVPPAQGLAKERQRALHRQQRQTHAVDHFPLMPDFFKRRLQRLGFPATAAQNPSRHAVERPADPLEQIGLPRDDFFEQPQKHPSDPS